MRKLAARKKRVKRTVSIGRVVPEAVSQVEDLDSRIEAIQWLIPLGLKAVTEKLQRAVIELAGPRYERKESDQPLRRWGSQPGSIYLGDQKLPVEVPRVRDVDSDTEVPLRAYQALQTPRQMDEGCLLRMLKGTATRNYEACAEAVPEAFGLSSSSVSRRYVKGTARKLAQFQERSLEGYDLVALFLDGKSFADEEIIIALGVTLDGQKIPLGFVRLRGGQEGTGRAQTEFGADESVRPAQPRRGPGRNPHPPSVGTDADTQGFLPHHQLHRERQQSPGAAHPQRTAMDQLITAPPLGSLGTARHRTTSA